MNQSPQPGEGWSIRNGSVDASLAWHYFREGLSLCVGRWKDPKGPLVARITQGGVVCTRCMSKRLDELQS